MRTRASAGQGSPETDAAGSPQEAGSQEGSAVPETYAAKLGARMRDLRLERGLSLASLRQAGGLTPSQMSSAERGRVQVTMGTVAAVAKALGMPAFVLMAFPDEDPLSKVLEEIRQAYGGDLAEASSDLGRRLLARESRKRPARRM
jgi:transcriptional regulator with XRE-family HTH domain